MRFKLECLAFATLCLTVFSVAPAADNPLAPYLEVPGAKTTLEVSSATSPFSLEFAQDAQKRFEDFHYQLGGDHALYYNLHLSEVLKTATSKPNALYQPLEKALDPELGD